MNKLIILTAITVVVYGRSCNLTKEFSDNDQLQYDKLTCTTKCEDVNRFTTVSSNLTNELTTIVDDNFAHDDNVRFTSS